MLQAIPVGWHIFLDEWGKRYLAAAMALPMISALNAWRKGEIKDRRSFLSSVWNGIKGDLALAVLGLLICIGQSEIWPQKNTATISKPLSMALHPTVNYRRTFSYKFFQENSGYKGPKGEPIYLPTISRNRLQSAYMARFLPVREIVFDLYRTRRDVTTDPDQIALDCIEYSILGELELRFENDWDINIAEFSGPDARIELPSATAKTRDRVYEKQIRELFHSNPIIYSARNAHSWISLPPQFALKQMSDQFSRTISISGPETSVVIVIGKGMQSGSVDEPMWGIIDQQGTPGWESNIPITINVKIGASPNQERLSAWANNIVSALNYLSWAAIKSELDSQATRFAAGQVEHAELHNAPRHIDDQRARALVGLIDHSLPLKPGVVEISYVAEGDHESIRFMNEVDAYIKSKGRATELSRAIGISPGFAADNVVVSTTMPELNIFVLPQR
ncbi:MAG: hypothetical protein KGO96_02400 [Elusimicrobia bacterium]|nr:hypothetical protein [Elusimicrobiota bacterium]MDE2424745.1 hypothetical protein [Elusimicrobiota bacterium]